MRPASGTVSASSLLVWNQCPQKWAAQYVDYIPTPTGSTRGMVGTVCHDCFENFVQAVYFAKTHTWDDKDYFLELLHEAFMKVFGHSSYSSEDYTDAKKLALDWYERTDLSGIEIYSTEKKTRTPTQVDDILLTYIFDRCDIVEGPNGERAIRVVDYKSVSQRWGFDDVRDKLQFRIYAVCALIEFKELKPEGVWVQADLLRFNETPAVYITREECVETWNEMQETVALILSTERDQAPYRLGTGCRFCPISATCPELQKNVDKGGVLAILDPEQALLTRAALQGKLEGLQSLIDHCEKVITDCAREEDITKLAARDEDSGQTYQVDILATGRRSVKNPSAVAKIVGPEIAARIGKFNMADLDKLIKGNELDDNQKAEIQGLIDKEWSPRLKFKQKGQ
ncbi:Cas4 family exonuclease [Gordonia phage Jumbo]|uniref:Cas4 family exonuclease n=1 Tax=Gordonia phage Jumbo TaxID=1887650 RepID=A0A1B3B0L7_9CAUD|nr:exonuclease [Gordonia phage Jumbo]AOE44555.1 Cas4 family exonuclease [Gordonia phage Jumbo]